MKYYLDIIHFLNVSYRCYYQRLAPINAVNQSDIHKHVNNHSYNHCPVVIPKHVNNRTIISQ